MALRPMITICGTTGVGKSKLAIDIAQHISVVGSKYGWRGAKVINADAMQVYEGLDIITNKVPEAERKGISHLLMGFKQPGEQYVVGQWVSDTMKLIDEMHGKRELPIIVGGTSYWIQHLMFPDRLLNRDVTSRPASPNVDAAVAEWSAELAESISKLPEDLSLLLHSLPQEPPSAKLDPDAAFQLHKLLSLLDPVISQRWHWRDTRKVLRSLEILRDMKRRPSDIIQEQSAAMPDVKPRYRSITFWLFAESPLLIPRLDKRVDDMLAQGLLDEVRCMKHLADSDTSTDDADPSTSSSTDYTSGIFQSIGYREFCSYIDSPSEKTYAEAVDRMKISTRQYAKRQISWIRNKLLPLVEAANADEPVVPFYLLDATNLEDWDKTAYQPAIQILEDFLQNMPLPEASSLSEVARRMLDVQKKDVDPVAVLQARQRRVCSVCTIENTRPVMIEEGPQWEIHQRTKSHRCMVRKRSEVVDTSREGTGQTA